MNLGFGIIKRVMQISIHQEKIQRKGVDKMRREIKGCIVVLVSVIVMTGCASTPLPDTIGAPVVPTAQAKRVAIEGFLSLQERDFAKAKALLEKADKLGHPDAPRALGLLYINGDGVAKDYAKAMEYFQKAFQRGNYVAAYDIGAMYKNGEGVPRDIDRAAAYFLIAAKKGYGLAQYELAKIYAYKGKKKEFLYWAKKAVKQGYKFQVNG